MSTYPLSDAKTNLSALVAVLIAPEDLVTLMDTLGWLSDPDHAAEIAEAEAAVEEGRTLSLAEVRAQLAEHR